VKFSNGSEILYDKGITFSEILDRSFSDLKDKAIAAKINGELVDLDEKLLYECLLEFITPDSPEGEKIFWHSTSHIMAGAVKDLFPEVKLGIGPAIEEGFYYDFDRDTPFSLEDLEKIEKRMNEIVKNDFPFQRRKLPKSEALMLFKKENETYKIEIISELEEDTVTLYEHDRFIDLCRGPHLLSTGMIKSFKLIKVAGAYWRGSEKNRMLQRIYGISYPTEQKLKLYLEKIEKAKERDHRKLGKELELYSFYEEAGAGLVFWHPKGAVIRKTIEDFWIKEHQMAGYELVYTPHIAKLELWKKSGHTDFYAEYMYQSIRAEDEEYQLKPMNCPFHMLIYQSKIRSYRDLPFKLAELGTVYRYERSGVLHGLMRVRSITQDDAHIFCSPEQLEDEVIKLLDFTLHLLKSFGFSDYQIYLATRPEKFIGETKDWDKATDTLKIALKKHQLEYNMDEAGGAFYGPKIDLHIKDALGRPWQCTTIQFDFNLPERFDLTYVGEDGKPHRPFIIHRALLGALERFFGVLIEHYAGAFPLWLSPVQVVVMPITSEIKNYARKVADLLLKKGLRVKLDDRSEKINYRIREAEIQKIPYMFIVGKREEKENKVSVRKHRKGDLGTFELDEIVSQLTKEIEDKTTGL